jgi:hypothetical protein
MVYSQDFLDSTLDNINNITAMTAGSSSPVVQVLFKGSGVHSVGGPTPFVELSTSVESNSVGIPESTTTKITLTGKIVRPQAANATGSGISHVLSGIKQLNDLFKPEEFGEFKIQCSSNDIYSVTGVKVVSVDISKTSDNWVQTADYIVVLEGYKSAISGYSVKGLVDSWSIESLEDYTYSSFTINNITQKQEHHNPNLKPTAPSVGNPQPGGTQSGGGGGMSPNVNTATLNVVSIPQFKVSHTVSAIGVPSGTGGTLSNTGLMNSIYLNAKAWVDYRLNYSITASSTSTPSGLIFLNNPGQTPPYHLATGYLYNHIRNTNFSMTEGKYEVVDNWIAMPTGIGFIEDYNIDMSTDEKYIHTVSVKGEIRGLSLGGEFGSAHTHVTGTNMSSLNAPPSLTGYGGTTGGTLNHDVPDVTSSVSAATTITTNKYQNALSGWIYDIKPYLYRRACVSMSTADRTVGYVAPYADNGPQSPPNNPVYAMHSLLNIIPVSTSESHNTRKGVISYSYDFNNKFTMITGVIAENVSIEDTGPVDVIGEAFVLGRALGPVLQNLGTKTTAKKSVSIEVTVVPPSSLAGFFMQNSVCPLWTGGTIFTTITGILEALKPFGDRASSFIGASPVTRGNATNDTGQVFVAQDNQSWDPTNGKYVRSVAWNYQQCTNSRNWLNH